MELLLTRDVYTTTTTTGTLSVDGKDGFYVLEDFDRGLNSGMSEAAIKAVKVAGLTCIPTGRYRVTWSWSNRKQAMTPRLQDVPGFRGILIHSGNRAVDTDGCLLVGTQRSADFVGHSKPAVEWLYPRIEKACSEPEGCWITIVRA